MIPGSNSSCCKGTCDGEPEQQHPRISARSLHTSVVEVTGFFEAQSSNQKLDIQTNLQLYSTFASSNASFS